MVRKLFAAVLLVAALAAASAAVPGLVENVAQACDINNPTCGG